MVKVQRISTKYSLKYISALFGYLMVVDTLL